MPDLTEADVREYLRQAEMATPGPWTTKAPTLDLMGWSTGTLVAATAPSKHNYVYATPSGGSFPSADRDFIAASRTMGPDLAEAWLRQRATIQDQTPYIAVLEARIEQLSEEIERLRAVAEAARLLALELSDWMIHRARDGWGNTNSNIVQRKRDTLLTALEGGGRNG